MLDGEALVAETTDTPSPVLEGTQGEVEVVEQPVGDDGVQQPVETTEQVEQPVEQLEAQPQEVLPEGTAPPQWLKAHYADPKVGKEAQRLWDTAQGYRQVFPTVAAAKQVSELVSSVGSVQDLQAAIQSANEKQLTDLAYDSGDPAQIKPLVEDWYNASPQGYVAMTHAGIEHLAQKDPAAYQEIGQKILEDTLTNLQSTAFRVGNKEAADRIEQLAKDIFGRGLNEPKRVDPRDAKYAEKEKSLNAREQKIQNTLVESFVTDSNQAVASDVLSMIDASLKTSLAGVKITDAAKGKIRENIYSDINQNLIKDSNLQTRLQSIGQNGKRRGQYTPEDRQQWRAAINARAKTLLSASAQKIINQWTQDYLGVVKAKTDKIKGAATRTDITGGGSPDMSLDKLTGDKMVNMTNDQIMSYKGPLHPEWRAQLREAKQKAGM